jgi:ribosomal protein S18 acetylase RimI-like enzyme
MVITVPTQARRHSGPRPINLNKDIPQVLRLLELVFGASVDVDGRQLLTGGAPLGQQPAFIWRLSPAANRLALGYVWEEDGRIIGNATVLTTETAERYLVVNVAVHPDYRRQGIARRLMQLIANLVRSRNGREILLQVVKENMAARNLYRSLDYTIIGSMTAWYTASSRLRLIEPANNGSGSGPYIRELRPQEWRAAYRLDQTSLHPDLNWPEVLPSDAYRTGFWRTLANFLNGRQIETWVTANTNYQLVGLGSILSEWGRSHQVIIRIHPAWYGQLERPLLAKLIRRFHYLPRRNVRIDHPDDDEVMNELLAEANFQPRRTLTHMRLDISKT